MNQLILNEVLDKINAADRMISALSKPAGSPAKRNWTMSIESFYTDPDVVIGAALAAAQGFLYELVGENERLRDRLGMMGKTME
jgi:hypothetical protein